MKIEKYDAFMGVRLPAGVYAAIEAEARRHKVSLSHVIRETLSKVVSADRRAANDLN